MVPRFTVVDVTYKDEKATIKTIVIDDERYIGYIFTFQDIILHPSADGIGVSYDLVIEQHRGLDGVSFTDQQVDAFRNTAHLIIETIMTDMVDTINTGSLDFEGAR